MHSGDINMHDDPRKGIRSIKSASTELFIYPFIYKTSEFSDFKKGLWIYIGDLIDRVDICWILSTTDGFIHISSATCNCLYIDIFGGISIFVI